MIVALLILAGAIIFFGGGKFFEKKLTVETYFDQPVEGLSIGAALQFQGVQIGNVSSIEFVFNEYKTKRHYVLVRAEIYGNKVSRKGRLFNSDEERVAGIKKMVQKGLRLQLASQGITGIAFLNAVYLNPDRYPPLEHEWKPTYIYIPSAPGTITQITQTIEELTRSINSIEFKQISKEIEALVDSMNNAVEQARVGELSKDLRVLVNSLNSTATELNKTLKSKDTKEVLSNITAITSDLRSTMNQTNRLFSTRQYNLKLTMENIERISEDTRELLDLLKKYPSWVLFGNPPPHIEGEENKK
jgi:phospholipid/cholesterol/gamma-HCH transport system substrate-binding protein